MIENKFTQVVLISYFKFIPCIEHRCMADNLEDEGSEMFDFLLLSDTSIDLKSITFLDIVGNY